MKASLTHPALTSEAARASQASPLADQRAVTTQQQQLQEAIGNSPRQVAQRQQLAAALPVQRQANTTGLPDTLKAGVENLSGYSLDDVRVHYNSAQPAQLQAHAYAQGTDIHVAPGQEQHLPHEAWHVVQQKQGRVRATRQLKGLALNDDEGLEREADRMGAQAARHPGAASPQPAQQAATAGPRQPVQRVAKKKPFKGSKYDKTRRQTILERLRRSRRRNATSKARPRQHRALFRAQQTANYGFVAALIARQLGEDGSGTTALVPHNPLRNADISARHTQVDIGGVNSYYYKGLGGQPFLRLDTESFDDSLIKSNYDEIISHFRGDDAQVALDILQTIEANKPLDTDQEGQAKALLILLTQMIEAHSSRIPGIDKLARALLRRIAVGQLTFYEAFNRKNGLFVAAWAKGGGATQGGQKAGRALFDASREKDRYSPEALEEDLGEERMEALLDTVDGYYSDDSDDEEDESPEAAPSLGSHTVQSVTEALGVLGIAHSISSTTDLLKLSALSKQIDKAYYKLALTHHPDKDTGDDDTFIAAAAAVKLLRQWITELNSGEKVDFAARELEGRLHASGLRLKEVDGNGNCFYAAILDQIVYFGGPALPAAELRNRVAQLIIDNADTFQVFVTGAQLNHIVESILTSHSWNNIGGDFAPQLIATVLQRPVRIIQPGGDLLIAPRTDLTLNAGNTLPVGTTQLTIIYNGHSHYDSTTQQQL